MAKTAQEKADLKAEKLYEKTHKRKYRLKPGDIVFNILNYLFFTLFTIACIFPFYYLFINTISDNDLVIKGLINFIPRGIHFDNYAALLNVSDLSSALIVSREFDTLKSKKVPQSLEIGLFFCQIFIFII